MRIRTLHFVYNVELTPAALVQDFLHRLRDPATYPCRLCDLTYGRFFKKPSWILFVSRLPVDSYFYTRDEFEKKHPSLGYAYPVVLSESADGTFEELLSKADLAGLPSLEDLEAEVTQRLAAANDQR